MLYNRTILFGDNISGQALAKQLFHVEQLYCPDAEQLFINPSIIFLPASLIDVNFIPY